MPINPFEAVVFNEGEPLDPDKLNKLQTNIANTYQTSSTLYNATVGQQSQPYVPVLDSGYWTFENLKAGKRASTKLTFNTAFSGIPHVIAGIRSDLRDGEQISVSVINLTGNPEIVCISNKDKASCRVEWIAMEKKTIS